MCRSVLIVFASLISCGIACSASNAPPANALPRAPAPISAVPYPPCAAGSASSALPEVAADPPTADDEAMAKKLLAIPAPKAEVSPRFSHDGTHPSPFRRPSFSRDGAFLYFSADENDDEAYALFRMSIASGAVEPVATGDKLQREGPFFTASGDRFFYTARKMSERGVVLYEQKGASATLAYSNPDLALLSVRDDGAQVLLVDGGKADALFMLDLPAKNAPRKLRCGRSGSRERRSSSWCRRVGMAPTIRRRAPRSPLACCVS